MYSQLTVKEVYKIHLLTKLKKKDNKERLYLNQPD